MDPQEMVVQAQQRFAKIRRDPEQALFSHFKGVSPSGSVTVWVDLMGKLTRLQLAPNTLYEGAESRLAEEIMAAYGAAKRAADILDFSMADLIRELDDALALKQRVQATRDTPPGDTRESGDDEWFENRNTLL